MSRKKLIEVNIPLEAINAASAREKSIRHGHPSTLHLWWSRKPLATTRAVLWASLVDAPDDKAQLDDLCKVLAELVQWENINNTDLLKKAKDRLPKNQKLPEFLDPFSGGGSIPLEAQRLGLDVHAHDLNPAAVMLNKAMIEIPPKFADMPHVHPDKPSELGLPPQGKGASGLADDVEYYGNILKDEAFSRIGHMYPKIDTQDGEAAVIAWLWARTVKCSNPECGCYMPLVSSFMLSKKTNHNAWVVPHVNGQEITYTVETEGTPPQDVKTGRGKFRCAACGATVGTDYLHEEFSNHRDGRVMIAVVAEGKNGRVYLAPNDEHVKAADVPLPEDFPDAEMPDEHHFSPRLYGLPKFADLFTNRQLTMLVTFSDLLEDIRERVRDDAVMTGRENAEEYADAVCVYLAFVIDKLADYHSSICSWHISGEKMRNTFGRQAIPMIWDYAEGNPFCDSSGSFDSMLGWVVNAVKNLPACASGEASQHDARELSSLRNVIISTDPPYYDNIGYADLSDYFYIWMRRNLRNIYPSLFRRVLTPKNEELIATPYRHDNSQKAAKKYFEDGMIQALRNIYQYAGDEYPTTIYYAYKQKESEDDGVVSTGWETMLNAVITAGFQVTGTWPIRTELTTALKANVNALASSVVLVLRKRPKNAGGITKAVFDGELEEALKEGLDVLRAGNIAPVDIPQAAIGKGMAVYSRYSRIVDTDGHAITVRDVLKQINNLLDPGAMNLDDESKFCVALYSLAGFSEIIYDDAMKIAREKGLSVERVIASGALTDNGGKVRLTARDKLRIPEKWEKLSVWSLAQILTQRMTAEGSDECGRLVSAAGKERCELARDLVYRLYLTAERRKELDDTRAYNDLVMFWPMIQKAAEKVNQDTARELEKQREEQRQGRFLDNKGEIRT